jgi:hypothetical protein
MTGYSRNVHKHKLLLHHMNIGLSAVIVWITPRRSLSAVVTLHARIGCYYVTHVSAVVTSHVRIGCCYITCMYQKMLHCMRVSVVVTSYARFSCCYITWTYQQMLHHMRVLAVVTSHARISSCYITCTYRLLLHHVHRQQLFFNHARPYRNYCTRAQVLVAISWDWWLSALLHFVQKDRPLFHQLRKHQLSLRHVRKCKL